MTTFSDETTSGRSPSHLRGLRRATILCRAEDSNQFEWVRALKAAYPQLQPKPKSSTLAPLMATDPRLRAKVFGHVETFAVFIVDLHAYRRKLLEPLARKMSSLIPPGQDPYQFILELPRSGSNARALLREFILNGSILGKLESLLTVLGNPAGLVDDDLELFDSVDRPTGLLERGSLRGISDRGVSEFLARLGAAVGDLLSPERQAEALIATHGAWPGAKSPYQAMREIALDVGETRIYDQGSAPAWSELQAAHETVVSYLNNQVFHRFRMKAEHGILKERSSVLELGLQAADIGAGIASTLYEEAADSGATARGNAVKIVFARVCLNGDWL